MISLSFTYQPLWDMLEDNGISKMEFARMINISSTTLAKLSKNEPITLSTIDKICNEFGCQIDNVVKHIRDVNTGIAVSESLLEVGTVIMIETIDEKSGEAVPLRPLPRVIVNIDRSNSEVPCYYIAPIYNSQSRIFDLKILFKNSEGVEKIRWINFSQTKPLPTNVSIKIIGKLSSIDVDIINKFFVSANEIITSANSNFYNR